MLTDGIWERHGCTDQQDTTVKCNRANKACKHKCKIEQWSIPFDQEAERTEAEKQLGIKNRRHVTSEKTQRNKLKMRGLFSQEKANRTETFDSNRNKQKQENFDFHIALQI